MRLRWVYDNTLGKWRVYVASGMLRGKEFQIDPDQMNPFLMEMAMRSQNGSQALVNESRATGMFYSSPSSGSIRF